MKLRGQTPATTAKMLINGAAYAAIQAVASAPREGWLHSRWHWYRFPFSLRQEVMWSDALGAWFCPEDESAIECMLHMSAYEPVQWVNPNRGEVFIDVGAYVGWYAIQAARRVGPEGRVLTLEPDRDNRIQLERNLKLNELANCTVVPCAAWSRKGRIGWHRGDQPVWHGVDEKQGEDFVEATTVDDLVSDYALDRVDWIKMDIEGGEIEALKGSANTIAKCKPRLFIEVHECTERLRALLESLNYGIEAESFDQPPERHGWILARAR